MSVFLDSNVLVYEWDAHDDLKREIARRLVRENPTATISTQVLQEFYAVATNKLKMDASAVRQICDNYGKLAVVSSDKSFVLEAMQACIDSHISIWDALIVHAAEVARCKILYTEDMNHGQTIRGVRIENPFIEP